MKHAASTQTSKFIKVPRETVYRACTDPAPLAAWLVPGQMTGKVHEFDLRLGEAYRMSLFYLSSDAAKRGKTSERENRYTARFIELTPPARIVEAIKFEPANAAFSGEMNLTVTLEERCRGTEVTISFEHIPPGISPEDNEAGTQESWEKVGPPSRVTV